LFFNEKYVQEVQGEGEESVIIKLSFNC